MSNSDSTTCHLVNRVSNLVTSIKEINKKNSEMNAIQRDGNDDTGNDESNMLNCSMPRLLRIPLVKVKSDHGPIKVSRYALAYSCVTTLH